jgi:hypothetical protein
MVRLSDKLNSWGLGTAKNAPARKDMGVVMMALKAPTASALLVRLANIRPIPLMASETNAANKNAIKILGVNGNPKSKAVPNNMGI